MNLTIEKLKKSFDAHPLERDYLKICERIASRPAGYHGEGHVGWTAICLYSSSADNIDLLDEAPAIRELLNELGLSLRLVRLMRLRAGGAIQRHQDTFLSTRIARLHIPIVTNDSVRFYIDDARCAWKPGELWYGDFSRPHWGVNEGEHDRIHLVLDVMADPALGRLFPSGHLPPSLEAHNDSPEKLADLSVLRRFQFDFDLPQGFCVPGLFDQPLPEALPGNVRLVDSELCVFVNQQPLLKAVPEAEDQLGLFGLGLPAHLHYEFDGDRPAHVKLVMGGHALTMYHHQPVSI
jgi:aspartyl/asparaginyl beta-hydroxylase (cupin superfamily)